MFVARSRLFIRCAGHYIKPDTHSFEAKASSGEPVLTLWRRKNKKPAARHKHNMPDCKKCVIQNNSTNNITKNGKEDNGQDEQTDNTLLQKAGFGAERRMYVGRHDGIKSCYREGS